MRWLRWELSYRLYFIILFVVFGAIIALLTLVVNYNLDLRSTRSELSKNAESEIGRKKQDLADYAGMLEKSIGALQNNTRLMKFIRHPSEENWRIAEDLFYTIAKTNPAFMQVRYLDETGLEKIRVDWLSGQQTPMKVKKGDLQNKHHRYYFVEASQVPVNSFWYSKLDLNVENNAIEVPYKPVLRIASPVYVDQKFRGIVIINAHAKEFLINLQKSPQFHISLLDKDGYYLVHHNKEFSWSRYLQTGHSLKDEYPQEVDEIFHSLGLNSQELPEGLHIASVATSLSKDSAFMLFTPKLDVVEKMKRERAKGTLLVVATIFLLSIPVSLLISLVPARLNRKISEQNAILTEYVGLIDENIITSTTDREGKIIEVSTAFSRISGYSKEELLGSFHEKMDHPDIPKDVYHSLSKVVKSGNIWRGEIKNSAREGRPFWLEAVIHPKFDSEKMVVGANGIFQDITDKKRIEKLSVTDELTGLYNRRFFNETIKKELNRALRSEEMLAFAMLDVDFFKQYNDHYGHQKGDQALTAIGQTLKQLLRRGSDFCFRLGGEEFGIIFTGFLPDESIVFADNILEAIEKIGIEHCCSEVAGVITVSMGMLSISPRPGITVDTLYKKADGALYAAKEKGRNQVVHETIG